jgi:hypothetical protein
MGLSRAWVVVFGALVLASACGGKIAGEPVGQTGPASEPPSTSIEVCLQLGAECQQDSDCCSEACQGRCVISWCQYVGQSCMDDGDCCGGNCVKGTCLAVYCSGEGMACRADSDCCYAPCVDGACGIARSGVRDGG